MKKIITFMLTLAAIFSTTMVASAYEDNDFPSLSSNKHEQFIVELNEENLRADALWQQALAESKLPENQIFNEPNHSVLPFAVGDYRIIAAYDDFDVDSAMNTASYAMTVTFIEGTDAYNHAVFDEIRSIDAYGTTSETQVTVNDVDYAIIDSGRTLSANFSLRIGVKRWDSEYIYCTKKTYVEFYGRA